MLFAVNKARLERAISIVRDDKTKQLQNRNGPFMRIEAGDNSLTLDGLEATATIPATVHEKGVLFLKITIFRKLLRTIKGVKLLTIQVTADELIFEQIRLPLVSNEMILYTDSSTAPREHPEASAKDKEQTKQNNEGLQMKLWNNESES